MPKVPRWTAADAESALELIETAKSTPGPED
jgi:hypothetical protein